MKTRRVGTAGLHTSVLGHGCVGMSEFYGPANETESVDGIHRAIELGITMFDTADMYGPFTNEELVGRALRGRREGCRFLARNGAHDSRKTLARWA